MTRGKLKRYQFLKELIKRTEEQIFDLEDRLQPHGMNMSGMPRSSTSKNSIDESITRLVDLKDRLAKYKKEKAEVESFIESVDNYQIRLILILRFVDAMEWKNVARAVGGNNTEDSVKKMCYRYLNKSQINSKTCPECPTCPE